MSFSHFSGSSPTNSRYERPSSRSSGRSVRAPSPALSLDDPVAVRNQISTLKHTIRHQQAQVNDLEIHLRASRLSDSMNTPISSPSRRTSYEVLQELAGPDSSLPLPTSASKREHSVNGSLDEYSIKEGIPPPSSYNYKRVSSPTRTYSRIPVAAVGNARALAEEGTGSNSALLNSPLPPSPSSPLPSTSPSSLQPPLSPNTATNSSKRVSLTPSGTTKVLADLQTGVTNARNALENTKAQLRLSQRSVASLTRQTEDLREGRERLRLENEGLNNVVARKERLLQEVLERARKAESEATQLRAQLKSETTTSKKSLREMEQALSESTALSQKSEREYIVLRDSLAHLKESFKADTDRLRDEIRKKEERWNGEREDLGRRYKRLVEEVKESRKCEDDVKKLREEDRRKADEVEDMWKEELEGMKKKVESSQRESDETAEVARQLAAELARLRRLMQSAGRAMVDNDDDDPPLVEK